MKIRVKKELKASLFSCVLSVGLLNSGMCGVCGECLHSAWALGEGCVRGNLLCSKGTSYSNDLVCVLDGFMGEHCKD